MDWLTFLSFLLVMLPLSGVAYHLFKKPGDLGAAWVFRTIGVLSGFLFAAVEIGYWGLIFFQAALVMPLTIWGFRKFRTARSP